MDLKKYLFPQQKYTENIIRRFAIYTPNKKSVRVAPISKIFDINKLEKLSAGIQARIYKHKDFNWVIKEGRWDLEFDLFGTGNMPVNVRIMEKLMGLFSFTFTPSLDKTLEQYESYLKFIQYFGYFDKKNSYVHPNLDMILDTQRHFRNSLLFYKPELEKHFNFKINSKIDSLLISDLRLHNYLPKEYLLYGKSFSPENKGKLTYFIIQDFIPGKNLNQLDETSLPHRTTKQLIIMLYIILLMDYQTGLLPDTRPKYLISQMYNWLLRTDNIRISEKNNDLMFIDTRWLWDRNANFIKRGTIIPEMIENLAKGYINLLLEELE
jgi:hypothetical protein